MAVVLGIQPAIGTLGRLAQELESRIELSGSQDSGDGVPPIALKYAQRRAITKELDSPSEIEVLLSTIEKSTLAIKELMRQNQEIKEEAANTAASLRAELDAERVRSQELREQIKALEHTNAALINDLAETKQELDRNLQSMGSIREELEETTAALEEKTEWLGRLTSRISSELYQAISDAHSLLQNNNVPTTTKK